MLSTHYLIVDHLHYFLFLLSLSPQGTNASIGDKWAAEISAEVKKAVASAFDSKYGRRSTMSFTGVSTFKLTILPLDLQNRNTHILMASEYDV